MTVFAPVLLVPLVRVQIFFVRTLWHFRTKIVWFVSVVAVSRKHTLSLSKRELRGLRLGLKENLTRYNQSLHNIGVVELFCLHWRLLSLHVLQSAYIGWRSLHRRM